MTTLLNRSAPAETAPATATEGSPFEPVAEVARYKPPKGRVDPDRSKTWLRRALPILRAHQGIFIMSLVLSFVGLVLQVQIPNLLNKALSNSLAPHVAPPGAFQWGRPKVLPACRCISTCGGWWCWRWWAWASASSPATTCSSPAYAIEFDFRNIIYEHLTNMSFPFYDRVQSGQLISRANSDIRSVQMYMTFAPMILVQCGVAVVAFVYMLSINVLLAFVAMVTMPFIYVVGVRMRKSMFPVSWLIQSRLADVATIVDENINGVRVVKSFAAEPEQLKSLVAAAQRVRWGYVKDADLRATWSPAIQNLPQLGLSLVLLMGGDMVIHGHLGVGAILAFNAYLHMLQAPFMMLGMIIMMGQRAAASAGRIYEILDEQPTVVDRPDATELTTCEGDIVFDHVDYAYAGAEDTPVLSGFDLHLVPGETVALVGRTGSGKSTVARLLARFYDVTEGAVRVDGHDVRDLTMASLRSHIGIVLDEPFLFSVSIADATCRLRRTGRFVRGDRRWPPGRPAPTTSSGPFPRDTTRSWASAATRCRAGSASASPSPARSS